MKKRKNLQTENAGFSNGFKHLKSRELHPQTTPSVFFILWQDTASRSGENKDELRYLVILVICLGFDLFWWYLFLVFLFVIWVTVVLVSSLFVLHVQISGAFGFLSLGCGSKKGT